MVLSLLLTTTLVLPAITLSNAPCTTFSDWLSSALVASSSSSMTGFFSTALAIAIRCFCPPDSCTPLSPQNVS
ncbi:hypothetical protein C4D60_Mb03t12230 [Musa balbisiana]|uniref:Secreted protein n=1 Tax=Musa balbisiana TaxID=52838 RepID=A0A4S8JB45_MUSBA|nr:hypothetical protein C4D60_Mb03t12230 [Musa balbisiana]